MKYIDEYRSPEIIEKYISAINRMATDKWNIMEICGGQTHAIFRFGLDRLLPHRINLLHGPGCPVCVTPAELVDKAIHLSLQPDVILCTFGDMMRVPGSGSDLMQARSHGADIRIVYSPLDAIDIARQKDGNSVVLFAIGFETTAPLIASVILTAQKLGLGNLSILNGMVRIPPAIESLLNNPNSRIDALLAPGHVCTVSGYTEYENISDEYKTYLLQAAMQADNTRAEEDAEQLKDKIALLSATGETPEESAHCPLCGQPLSESDCSHLLSSFEDQLQAEREAYRQRNVQMNENQRRISEYKATVAEIDRELRERTGWQRKEAALAHVVQEAQEAQEALPEAQEKLGVVQVELEAKAYAPEARAELLAVEQQLSELGYEADAHRQIQTRLNELRPFEVRMQTLREARSGVEPGRLAIERLEQRRAEVEVRLVEEQEQAAALREVVEQIPDLERQALEARQILERAHDREQQANLRLGAARNKVEHCQDLKEQRVRRLEEERALREEQAVYQELQRAFGKNGVQAMLIESAIPDIEQEANRLLARMTQGRMHVRFETQRDTKTGDTVETLDIHITDELGTRSYETYSGGERYRINFAIRIALSKLLARRAGAQLQMLVIDEGFGTQDNEGRDGVIDAINAVRDDFACILAITHIEELKNVFNVRIEVEKTGEGSEIRVI